MQYISQMLEELGRRIRTLREKKKLSRKELASRAGLSLRFVVEVEAGRGNIALSRFFDLCAALNADPSKILAGIGSKKRLVALIGLRGAGKTTLGKKLSRKLRVPFFELDELVEKAAGLTLQNIFEVHGEDYYRKVEYDVLIELLSTQRAAVISAGGGIVTREQTYNLLLEHCTTIWLQADPEDHYDRVLKQDPRPIINHPNAMSQLKELLRSRENLYSRADYHLNTSKKKLTESIREVAAFVVNNDRDRG